MTITDSEFIFVGGFSPDHRLPEVQNRSKVPLQFAAETFQWSFIKGIEFNINKSMHLITAPFFGSYPRHHHDWYIKSFKFSHQNSSFNLSIGYLNLPLIKNIFKFFGLTRQLLINTSNSNENIVFVYSVNLAYVLAAVFSKLFNRTIKICLIITDLPEFPADSSIAYRAYLKYIEGPIFYKLVKHIDKFVTLTKYIPIAIGADPEKCITVEGLFDLSNTSKFVSQKNKNRNKIVLYTGTLDNRYGINRLIEEFSMINENDIELWICGGGNAVEDIKQAAKVNSKIVFLGLKPRSEILRLQSTCDLLVNPRNNDGDYNKYSFPSKLMEYMASGTPVLCYRLDGIPSEYYDYIYTIECEKGEKLHQAIVRVLSYTKSSLLKTSQSAQAFIYDAKNSWVQTKKVLDHLRSN